MGRSDVDRHADVVRAAPDARLHLLGQRRERRAYEQKRAHSERGEATHAAHQSFSTGA